MRQIVCKYFIFGGIESGHVHDLCSVVRVSDTPRKAYRHIVNTDFFLFNAQT